MYAEVLLIGCPRLVLELQGDVYHEGGHASLGEGCGELLIAHGKVLGLELCTGSIFEVVATQAIDDGDVVASLSEYLLQSSYNIAVLCPAALLVVLEGARVHTDGRS